MKSTFDFDFKSGEFKLKNGNPVILSGINALRLWVQKTIRTQLDRYSIYTGKTYGANIEDLIIGKGFGFDFVESELRREIETALTLHEDIQNMSSFSIERNGTALNIVFTLTTTYGTITEGYEYDS